MVFLDKLALATLPMVPTPIMRRLASRYIAGEHLDDAVACLQHLEGQGYRGALDILGEDVSDAVEARSVASAYQEAGKTLRQHGLGIYLSVKPTHLGLRIDEELCFGLYAELLAAARELDGFVRVEMEDHTTTDATLRVFERLRRIDAERVGIVLQARLLRTPADIEALAPGPLSVRMVKGVYLEPPSIAHTEPEPIRTAYLEGCLRLWERGARVALATHDNVLADRLFERMRRREIGQDRYEMQVLLGVRRPLWKLWRESGHPVRVYVPYGPNWRAYSTRRLQKNPEIFRHVVRDLLLRRA